MTAEEIRGMGSWLELVSGHDSTPIAIEVFKARMLQEIAAQLADLKSHLDWVTDAGYVRVENRS